MNKRFLIAILFFPALFWAQDRKSIDSLNNLSFDTKTNRAATIGKLFHENAAAAKKIGYALGEADSYANLGLIYYYRGKYEQSVAFRLRAIAIYEAIGNRTKLAHEYGELGYAMKRRNMPRAQSYMRKAIAIAEKDQLRFELCGIYDNYGVLKEMQNQLDSAMLFYRKGLQLKEQFADSIGIPYSLNNIAGLYAMRKRYDEALPVYEKALQIRVARRDFAGMAETYASIAALFAETKQLDKAVENYRKSIASAQQNGYIHHAALTFQSLADVYEKQGKTDLAYDSYKQYVTYKDSVLNKETNTRIAELEVQFETQKKEKMLLEKQAEVNQQRQYILVVSLIAVCVAAVGYLLYRQQKIRNRQQAQEHELRAAIAQIETQNQLQQQRLEISRDLHDNIGSQLTFIISSVDNLRYAFDLNDSKIGQKLQSIGSFTRDTIVELRDTIWAMNHNDIGLEDLRVRIANFIEKAQEAATDVQFSFAIADGLSGVRLTSVQGMNLYRVIQEAVNNALKYADAKNIAISISKSGNNIDIVVTDDGRGFDPAQAPSGNGLLNMQKRSESVGGSFSLRTSPGNGTTITLVLDQNALRS